MNRTKKKVYQGQILIICLNGFTSSFLACALQKLGYKADYSSIFLMDDKLPETDLLIVAPQANYPLELERRLKNHDVKILTIKREDYKNWNVKGLAGMIEKLN